jgi:signal peptidase I
MKEAFMTKKMVKEIFSWVMVVVIAFALAIVINKLIIYKVSPPTASMENTIMVGDKVVTFRLAYLFSSPKRGDIVVFQAPDIPEEDYIKRVIGLPGETVEVREGFVYIDGEPLTEDYLKEPMTGEYGPFVVPEGHYFMMGDNRNISLDARYWENKYVAKNKIRGKAIFKYPDFEWLY